MIDEWVYNIETKKAWRLDDDPEKEVYRDKSGRVRFNGRIGNYRFYPCCPLEAPTSEIPETGDQMSIFDFETEGEGINFQCFNSYKVGRNGIHFDPCPFADKFGHRTKKCHDCEAYDAFYGLVREFEAVGVPYAASHELAKRELGIHSAYTKNLEPIGQCERVCDVKWCSIECFERRGYHMKDGEWVRDDEGEPKRMMEERRECDVE